MILATARERSRSELVFGLLRTLMIGYQLWGVDSAVPLTELPAALHTTGSRIGTALRFLSGEGLICVDEVAGTVRLSDSGARHLLGLPDASKGPVVFPPVTWH
jgi:hypothetical protein